MTDLDLLEIEASMSLDPHGRIERLGGIMIAVSSEGRAWWLGASVPDKLARELNDLVTESPKSAHPDQAPAAFDACERAIKAALGTRVMRHAGPSYVFPNRATPSASIPLVRSDLPRGADLRDANPGNWTAIEWEELLDSRLGPWAMVVSGGEVLSICHTPLPVTADAAECGVWTRPDARGRGYAAAAAAAWASMLEPTGRRLFYHHDADNISSQRVAERLGLRRIGWQWRVGIDERPRDVHSLDSEASGMLDRG